ncbi:STAS domain-containing protein [Saccharopolyspora taberi]|uniref:Anti-sigma factor antagonist n=1 Tax=Saccharopolyspora taberi TaxID=60895 RepID=A0ABN3VD02_9PSEU
MIVFRSGAPRREVAPWVPGGLIAAPRAAGDPPLQHSCGTPALRLSVEWPAPGVVVVGVRGEIDLACVPRLTELVRQRLTAASLRAVVIDVSGVTYSSSAGLELLIHAHRRAEHRGIDLYVVPGDGPVRRLLELTGLRDHFTCRDTTAEALADARH